MEKLTLSIKEAAEATGVSQATIYRLIKNKQLPVTRFGKRTLISKQLLTELINPATETREDENFQKLKTDIETNGG